MTATQDAATGTEAPTRHQGILDFVNEVAALTKPDRVHWCTGSDEEWKELTDALVASMERVEKKIDPVLKPLRDRVLFLKHNLNARALGALTKELTSVSQDVDALVTDMQQAIGEADAYLKSMEQAQAS